MKLKRTELDVLGQEALKHLKTTHPELTRANLAKIFGRLYCKLLKENKIES